MNNLIEEEHSMPGSPPGPISTDDDNTPKLETPEPSKINQSNVLNINDEYNTKEDEKEK